MRMTTGRVFSRPSALAAPEPELSTLESSAQVGLGVFDFFLIVGSIQPKSSQA